MSVKITLEYTNVEEAIAALGKLAGIAPVVAAAPATTAPAEPVTKTRKGRSDAGKERGPNARTTGDNPNATLAADLQQQKAAEQPPVAPTPAPTLAAVPTPVPAAPAAAPQAPVQPIVQPVAAGPVPTPEQVQAAVEKLFNAKGYEDCAGVLSRFGVKRGKDLLEPQRAEFIAKVDRVIAGEAI